MNAISYLNLTKVFKGSAFREKKALTSVTFDIPKGKITGLLGANGSGKSTLFKLTLGFISPTQGNIQILDQPFSTPSKAFIGYVPENPRFQKFLTATETLYYLGQLHQLSKKELSTRIPQYLETVGLRDAANERVGGFSKGMVQRLCLCQALLASPKILILDEPMSGLDPLGRQEIKQLLSRIHQQDNDLTIFFSSHVLSDISEIADQFFVLKKGEMVSRGTFEDFQNKLGNQFEIKFRAENHTQTKLISEFPDLMSFLRTFENNEDKLVSLQTLKTDWDNLYSQQSETAK